MNETRFQIHKSTDDVMKNVKEGFKTVLIWVAETGTVIAIGWCFMFLVDKQTAKMIKLIIVMCFITEVIKMISRFINFVHT